MNILQTILGPPSAMARPGPTDDYWYNPGNFAGSLQAAQSHSGETVNTDTALGVSAVYACVKVIAETMATLPLKLYRWTGSGPLRGKEPAVDHPLYTLLHDQPNGWQTAFEFVEMMTAHCALNGNAICQIIPGLVGAVSTIEPMIGRIEITQLENKRLRYAWHHDDGTREELSQDDVFHVRNWSQDGIVGMSPIALASNTIGRAIAQSKYSGSLYRDGTVPHGILRTEKKLGPKGRGELANEWAKGHSGPSNAGKVAVVDQGLDWTSTGMTAEDAQMIEAMKFSVSDIARIYRVPPHLIADLDNATYANIEQQDIGLTKHTIAPWCGRWTGGIRRDLIVEKAKYFAQFNLDGLQAGDIATRYEAHSKALGGLPFKKINEVRQEESYNPIEGGDEIARPLNIERPSGRDDGSGPPDGDGSATPPVPPAPPEDEKASAAMAGLIEDAACRIARREAKALAVRADKAPADPQRFAAWAAELLAKHADDVLHAVEPLAVAWAMLGGSEIDAAALAVRITAAGGEAIQDEPVAAMADWEHTRAAAVAAAITRELKR